MPKALKTKVETLENLPYVPPQLGEGNKFLIVGEAPGSTEVAAGIPFVGPSGNILNNTLLAAGMNRKQFDCTNVIPWRPPNNKIELVLGTKYHTDGLAALKELIHGKRYTAILGLGWLALESLTGRTGIHERRGSVYVLRESLLENDDARPPVLCTLHPAYLFEEPKLANVFARDIQRFARLGSVGRLEPRKRKVITFPNGTDLAEAALLLGRSPVMACDIETDGNDISCCSFAPHADWTISVPVEQRDFIREMLALPNTKVFHNASYDVTFLEHRLGWIINGKIEDTMLMHHALHPELPKSLGFLTSLYTDEPYYKDTGKTWRAKRDLGAFYVYNAMDSACTIEIYPQLKAELEKAGLTDVYDWERRLLPVAIDMSKRGIRYDNSEAQRLKVRTQRTIDRWQSVLNGRAGYPLLTGSYKKVAKLLYEDLGLPTQYLRDKKTGIKKVTTKQQVILNIYPAISDRKTRRTVRALLRCRQAKKFMSSYLNQEPSSDGRMRTSFNVGGTETGRWSASEFLITEGTNLQTVPPAWKSCFLADEGKILVNLDYSQIEARLVAYDAEDLAQITVFESNGGDIHRENAARIFDKEPASISDKERYVGKTCVHALNYGIGPITLAESVNRKGLETDNWITVQFARLVRERYLDKYDRVVRWQNRQWDAVRRTRTLVNFFGRRRIFLGPTKGDLAEATKGEAIAFVPQSTVPDMLGRAILSICSDSRLTDRGVTLLLQGHDALMVQGNEATVHEWAPIVKEHMTIPLTIRGRTCIVPVDMKVGRRWSKMSKLGT